MIAASRLTHLIALALVASLAFGCGAPPPEEDVTLLLRQRSLGTVTEVTVETESLKVVVTQRGRVLDHETRKISADDAAKLRRAFWKAFLNQPTRDLMPIRDLGFEQEWRGDARSQLVRIEGYPLSRAEYQAFDQLNQLLSVRHRFAIDAKPYRRLRNG